MLLIYLLLSAVVGQDGPQITLTETILLLYIFILLSVLAQQSFRWESPIQENLLFVSILSK